MKVIAATTLAQMALAVTVDKSTVRAGSVKIAEPVDEGYDRCFVKEKACMADDCQKKHGEDSCDNAASSAEAVALSCLSEEDQQACFQYVLDPGFAATRGERGLNEEDNRKFRVCAQCLKNSGQATVSSGAVKLAGADKEGRDRCFGKEKACMTEDWAAGCEQMNGYEPCYASTSGYAARFAEAGALSCLSKEDQQGCFKHVLDTAGDVLNQAGDKLEPDEIDHLDTCVQCLSNSGTDADPEHVDPTNPPDHLESAADAAADDADAAEAAADDAAADSSQHRFIDKIGDFLKNPFGLFN